MPKQKLALNERGADVLDGRQVRAMAFVPAREQILDRIDARKSDRGRALVVGGGYSPIAASLRDRGYTTTAVDPSPAATALAEAEVHGITFFTGIPTALGAEDEWFDLVYCADTLEVVDDAVAVLAELARVARPGATIILDTVTDTLIAKLIYLLAFQRLPFTRIMPQRRYSASRLRNPRYLAGACLQLGIAIDSVVGFEPESVGSLVRAVLNRRAGKITDDDIPDTAGFHLSLDDDDPVVTYFAIATKQP